MSAERNELFLHLTYNGRDNQKEMEILLEHLTLLRSLIDFITDNNFLVKSSNTKAIEIFNGINKSYNNLVDNFNDRRELIRQVAKLETTKIYI